MTFKYPLLPPSDGLRILTLQPGDFWAPLIGTLAAVPFSTKPKYLALSYTWADPDQEHAGIPAMPKAPAPVAVKATKTASSVASGPTSPEEEDTGSDSESYPGEVKADIEEPREKPHMIINGEPMPLLHNASLALRFIRSETHHLALWLDAICIDQSSIKERNGQVAIMAFIFTRAAAVVSWLGVPPALELAAYTDGNSQSDYETLMRTAWQKGDSRQIAERLADRRSRRTLDPNILRARTPEMMQASDTSKPLSLTSNPGERLLYNPYWERLWVVQEVCLPRSLYFLFGGEIFSEAVVRDMKRSPTMDRLLDARSKRFSDAMRMEALIERFMNSGCAELRDRVFGLLGLANDVDSFALEIPGSTSPVVGEPGQPESESVRPLYRTRTTTSSSRKRGVLAMPNRSPHRLVDGNDSESYSDSESDSNAPISGSGLALPFNASGVKTAIGGLFNSGSQSTVKSKGVVLNKSITDTRAGGRYQVSDLARVPTFLLKKVRGRGMLEINYQRPFYDIWCDVVSFMHNRAKPLLDFGEEDEEMEDERRIRVVRFAGVLQLAFEGKVDHELFRSGTPGQIRKGRIIAKGYIAGTILHLGPSYRDFVGSYREQQRWVGSWDSHYHTASGLEKLRQMDEVYSTKILDYHDIHLARVCSIFSPETRAWSALQPGWIHSYSIRPAAPSSVTPEVMVDEARKDPVRFMGSEFCMGLAPTAARVGDLVIRFWNCDAAIVVRRVSGGMEQVGDGAEYLLVGRADVAEPYVRQDGEDDQAREAMRVVEEDKDGNDLRERPLTRNRTRGVYVAMDSGTLQKISAAIDI